MTCITSGTNAVDVLGEHRYFDRPGNPEYVRRLGTGNDLTPDPILTSSQYFAISTAFSPILSA